MIGAILSGLAITVASLLCGQAIMRLSGAERYFTAAPAVGVSALLVICGIAVKLPGGAVTAAVAAVIAVALALGVLWREEGQLDAGWLAPLAVVLLAAVVAAIPFAASGRIGILGQGLVNDDMASHLLFTEWLDTDAGGAPELVEDGYPLGPHALVAGATKLTGAGVIEGFAGLTGAIAILTAITAYAALSRTRILLRVPASVLVAFSYLGAAYLAQGAFKEPLLGLALLGFALSLPALRRGGLRAAVPPGVIAAGTVYNYSFPGLAWLIAAIGAWLLIVAAAERRRRGLRLAERLRHSRAQLAVIAGLPLVAAIPELFRLLSFTDFKAFNPGGEGARVGFGNLRQPLSPLEALGIWPSTEFRITPANASAPELAFYAGALLGVLVLGWGLWRALRRREAALPAALAGGALGYLGALAAGTPYTQAKALAIAAPVVMLIGMRGLLRGGALEGEPGLEAGEPERAALFARWSAPTPLVRWGIVGAGIVFALGAAGSSLLPLRQAAVGPEAQTEQLIGMRSLVEGEDVLFLGRESFVAWELIGADVYAPIVHNYNVTEVPSLYRATSTRAKFDFDVVPREVLESGAEDEGEPAPFDYVITTRAAERSEAPANFEPLRETRDYVLWQRQGPLPPRRTLIEPLGPGAVVDCKRPAERTLPRIDGTARAFTTPPVAGIAWKPSAEVTDGAPAREELMLGPGRWQISLQYASTQPVHLRALGLEVTLEPNLLFRGPSPFYPVGELELDRRRLVPFEISVDAPPLTGRLLGAETRAYLEYVAATPAPSRETVPLSRSCGRYLDWYAAGPGTPESLLDRIEAPRPHEVVED